MTVYSRYFLCFLRGLLGQWLQAEAFLFHTRLVRVSEVLREGDPAAFNDRYAKATLTSRSLVLVMSDGYDTDPPLSLAFELERLKRRSRRLVWLNPLLGWKDYAPVARAMAVALDYVDHFASAHSLASLAALESEFARL
jgi:uncharacterized protein with von Willebrand factor type A (vWA) domain